MLTAAALLELDFEQPSLDYHSLMKLTKILTRDNPEDLRNMFRRMCFNVYAHNRDDHSKNFTYLYYEEKDCWRLSPAYDLTYSNTYYGEHTTTVDGNGRNPGEKGAHIGWMLLLLLVLSKGIASVQASAAPVSTAAKSADGKIVTKGSDKYYRYKDGSYAKNTWINVYEIGRAHV